jgi:hypothetical protein
MAIASRIASYYQQRCQAVAAFQQQRCQAWANAQRQKCQEMMQAATVIVAWYIRDRISRRRKRRRRAFRRGLAVRGGDRDVGGFGAGAGGRVTKGEAVRRWVMGVPIERKKRRGDGGGGDESSAAASSNSKGLPADKAEADFDMDRDVPADKDSQLFSVADNLIKSHLARVDVPLLGVLSFDESESESESEDDFMAYEEGEEEDDEDDEEYEDEEGTEVDGECEKEEEVRRRAGGVVKEELASTSKDAQPGTTAKGSRKRSHSLIS